MLRSVSCRWGYELRAHFLLWFTADGMGLAVLLLLLPYTDSQEPGPHHSLVASTGLGHPFKKQEGVERNLVEMLPSVKRACPMSCPLHFLLRQKLETRRPSLF